MAEAVNHLEVVWMHEILSDMILFSSLIIQNWWDPQKTFCLDSSLIFGDSVLVIPSLKKMSDENRKWKQVSPVFITQNLIFGGMFVNSWRLWAPNLTSHRSHSLFFLFFLFSFPFYFSLFLSSSFCFLPIQYSFFFVLLPPVTHTSTHADPSWEIIGVDLRSHSEKLHHALVLLIAAIVGIQSFLLIWPERRNRHPQQRFNLEARSSI